MAGKTTRTEIRKALNQLDDEQREAVLNHAQRLAKSNDSRESLSKDGQPSFLAKIAPEKYERKRKEIEQGQRPDPRQ